MDDRARALAGRFRVTLDLHEAGVAIMRQNLRRRHPDASDAEIRALLRRWLEGGPVEGEPPGTDLG